MSILNIGTPTLKAPKKESRAKTKLLKAQRRRRRRQHAGAKVNHRFGTLFPKPKVSVVMASRQAGKTALGIPNEGGVDPRILERFGKPKRVFHKGYPRGTEKAGE